MGLLSSAPLDTPFDTRGATLLVAVECGFGTPGIVDNQANSWTPLDLAHLGGLGNAVNMRVFIKVNPVTSATHQVSDLGAMSFVSGFCLAFNGFTTKDQESGVDSQFVSAVQAGSITPGSDNQLLIFAVGSNSQPFGAVDSGFTEVQSEDPSGRYGTAIAYKIQTAAAAVNPSWAFTGGSNLCAATLASFIESPGTPVTVTAADATAQESPNDQTLALSATVVNGAPISEGIVEFTLLDGVDVIGTPISGAVVSGVASVSYTLPGGTTFGTYTIRAAYSGSSTYASGMDDATLTVEEVPTEVITRKMLSAEGLELLAWSDLYLKDASGNPTTVKLGTHNLQDPSAYTGGKKIPRICRTGYYDRALTGPDGVYKATSLEVEYDDTDYRFRGMLDSFYQYGLLNAEVLHWVISEQHWRARYLPLAYFRGRIGRYKPTRDRKFSITIRDWWGDRIVARSANQATPVLGLPFLIDDFINLPAPVRALRSPLHLGRISDEPSTGDIPVIANEPGNGSSGPSAGFFLAGFADRGGAPTGFTGTPDVGGGSLTAGTYNCVVDFRATGADEWTEVAPFIDGLDVVVADGDAIDFNCDNMGTGTYRYSFSAPTADGRRFPWYIESATRAVTWDGTNHSVYDQSDTWIHQYEAMLEYSDGFSGVSGTPVIWVGVGPQRQGRFAFGPVETSLSGRVVRKNALGEYLWQFDVPATQIVNIGGDDYYYFEDTPNSTNGIPINGLTLPHGRVPTLIVGSGFIDKLGIASDWVGVLLSYGAITEIEGVYQEATAGGGDGVRLADAVFLAGGEAAFPGLGDWATLFGPELYYENHDRRYALGYVRGSLKTALLGASLDGSDGQRITYNGTGIETLNTGLGTAITSVYRQLLWLFQNFLAADDPHPSVGGAWLATPSFSDGVARISETDFLQAETDSTQFLSSNARGFYIRGEETTIDVLRDMLVSGWVSFGPLLSGAAMLTMLPPCPPGSVGDATITQISEVLGDTLDIEDEPDPRANVVEAHYDLDDSTNQFNFFVESRETDARTKYQDTADLIYSLACRGVFSAAIAGQLADLARVYFRKPERTVRLGRAFHAIHDDLGKRLYLTHPEGIGATGYSGRLVQINRVTPNFDTASVMAALYDLGWITTDSISWIVEEFMSDLWFGRAKQNSCVDDDEDPLFVGINVPYDAQRVLVPWGRVPTGYTVKAYVWVSTSTGTITPRIRNLTDTNNAATGSAHTSSTFEANTPLTLGRLVGDKEYALFLDGGGGAGAMNMRAYGFIRIEPGT